MTSRKLFQYPESAMQDALKAIREDNMPVARACKQYNVPRTSVRNRLSGKTVDNCRRVGPECVLGPKIEKRISDWILECAARGFPINKEGLLYSVQKIIEECHIETRFISNTPGRKWFDSFMKRHPEITKKQAEFINKARAAVSERNIRQWFKETMDLLGPDRTVLEDPDRIFNMDETAMFLSPKGALVLGPKGKHIYDVGTSDKDNVTTLIAVNARGTFAPPLTIYKFKRLPRQYVETAPKSWAIGVSDSGWMQSKQFYEYFANIFINFLNSSDIVRPVVVFVDGHASHLSLHLSNLCRVNGIILICLPPNTTHLLQPLDVAFFYPLKQAWKKITRKWLFDHEGKNIQKKDIPTALHSILTQHDFSNSIIAGFRICGLYPFDDNAPRYDKCVKKTSQLFQEEPMPAIPGNNNEMNHLEFIETKIDSFVLQSFKETFNGNYYWQGEERFLELYNFWKTVKDNMNQETNAIPPIHSDALTHYDEEIYSFDFPEFSSIDQTTTENKTPTTQMIDNNLSAHPTAFVDHSEKKINILQNIIIQPAENENNTKDKDTDKDQMKTMKKRTISDVLKTVQTWPEESQISDKVKRKRITLPSVVTSDKWIEIQEAKVNSSVKENKRKRQNNKSIDKENISINRQKTSKIQTTKENQETQKQLNLFKVGTYVIIKYDKQFYPAKIVSEDRGEYYCCAMQKSSKDHWRWSDPHDLLWYNEEDIILQIREPLAVNSRGVYAVPEMKNFNNFS